jgi:hypothetical protein
MHYNSLFQLVEIFESCWHSKLLDNMVEEDFFYHKLKEFMIHMKQIVEVLLPFISFLHAFDRTRGHNMLALMFNSHFQNILLVTMYLGQENIVAIVVEYDDELLLTLLTEVAKFLMLSSGAKFENLMTQVNSENLFFITTNVNTYKDLVQENLLAITSILLM